MLQYRLPRVRLSSWIQRGSIFIDWETGFWAKYTPDVPSKEKSDFNINLKNIKNHNNFEIVILGQICRLQSSNMAYFECFGKITIILSKWALRVFSECSLHTNIFLNWFSEKNKNWGLGQGRWTLKKVFRL